MEDAENRNLLWPVDDSAELCDEDAEGEDDPDYVKGTDGQFVLADTITPIGFRTPSGQIEPLLARKTESNRRPNDVPADVPQNLHDIVRYLFQAVNSSNSIIGGQRNSESLRH